MYQASISVRQEGNPAAIIVMDGGTGDETLTSRAVEVTKTDLVVETYMFEDGETELEITGFDKDYALNIKFIGTVEVEGTDSVYEDEVEIAMLGYAQQGFTQRKIDLEVDESIVNKRAHREQSNDIIYYMDVAEDCVQFSDLVGAQKALDYIAEIIAAGTNSN